MIPTLLINNLLSLNGLGQRIYEISLFRHLWLVFYLESLVFLLRSNIALSTYLLVSQVIKCNYVCGEIKTMVYAVFWQTRC